MEKERILSAMDDRSRDNEIRQSLFRSMLERTRGMAKAAGLGEWVERTLSENKSGRCAATDEQVDMLSRMLDEERIDRRDVPRELGLSYRFCVENGVFERLRKLLHLGTYSRTDTAVMKNKLKKV